MVRGSIPDDDLIFVNVRGALAQKGCPICRLARQATVRHLGGFLHEQVNDPGTREELVASRGFCQHHAWALTSFHDGLGVAIVYRHLVQELIGDLQQFVKRPGVRSGRRQQGAGAGLSAALRPKKGCPICKTASRVEEASLHGLLKRLDDLEVSKRLGGDALLCFPHLLTAVEMSADPAIAGRVIQMHIVGYQNLIGHLNEFIRKHDYRFRSEGISSPEAESWTTALELLVGQDPHEERKIRSVLE
jgi:hypothetical protein